MIPIILDMDPGIDDAVALSIALSNPSIDIKLLTSVAGNVSVDKTTNNLLKLTTFFHQTQIPVAKGAAAPLKKDFSDAAYIHGESGMPGYDLPQVTKEAIKLDAITAMAEELEASDRANDYCCYWVVYEYCNVDPKISKSTSQD